MSTVEAHERPREIARRIAKSMIRSLNLELALEPRRLYDPSWLAESLGIAVRRISLMGREARLHTVSNKHSILLSTSANERSQRFSCAHEIGHFLINRGSSGFLKEIYEVQKFGIDWRGIEEMACNEFAGELILPDFVVSDYMVGRLSEGPMTFFELLDFARCSFTVAAIRMSGATQKLVFIKANTKEYGDRSGRPRVRWSAAPEGVFIPIGKALGEKSVVGKAMFHGGFVSGWDENVRMGSLRGNYYIEAFTNRRGGTVLGAFYSGEVLADRRDRELNSLPLRTESLERWPRQLRLWEKDTLD